MALATVAYVSDAREGLTLRDLKQILRRSREKNFRAGISGILVFDGIHFAQLLEGEEARLEALLPGIESDSRHHDLRQLLHSPIEARHFPDSCMGCANLAAPVHLDTSELRGVIRDVVGSRSLALPDALQFFRLFQTFRTPQHAALLSL